MGDHKIEYSIADYRKTLLNPFSRKFRPVLVEVIIKMKENPQKMWSAIELANELNRCRDAVRTALRYLVLADMVSVVVDKRMNGRWVSKQRFVPTKKLLEFDLFKGT